MDKCELLMSNFTLGILCKMYGKRNQLDKAFEALESARKLGNFTPNSQVLTCLMCSCVNTGAVVRALGVFEELRRTPQGADERAITMIVLGCVRHGYLAEACALVEQAYGLDS